MELENEKSNIFRLNKTLKTLIFLFHRLKKEFLILTKQKAEQPLIQKKIKSIILPRLYSFLNS
jgi:hypothetical protein